MTSIRIGFGFDVHQLVDNIPFFLGGIEIKHSKGAKGHSDADVLLHAICDAVLGAANLRDIGYHFPDTDETYKGIDSKILLGKVMTLLKQKGFQFVNLDATICLQLPKINPFIPQMQQTIAELMDADSEQISIKATTTEKLSFVGREEGISAYATVLIEKVV